MLKEKQRCLWRRQTWVLIPAFCGSKMALPTLFHLAENSYSGFMTPVKNVKLIFSSLNVDEQLLQCCHKTK